MKGRFLVLDGIDGCGKSTQIKHLAEWLPLSGVMPKNSKLIITREPGGTQLGFSLRELLLKTSTNTSPNSITELLLYAADRAQHVSEVILPALNNGDWVLSDRFSGSTLAYQGYGRELNFEIINQLEIIATQGLSPDITFWLDLSLEESLNRRSRKQNDRIEAEGKSFLKKVLSGFKSLGEEREWIRINASNATAQVSEEIESELKKILINLENKY
tara:strand:+ start:12006 stop:12653 length:648 start_codon:yes stop_codon:yes gene_type:complete